MSFELSRTERETLKSIWRITQDESEAHTVLLAERIGTSPATVTATVKRLGAAGLVDHRPYRGALLTVPGRRAALDSLRRHRLVESFLADLLGIDWRRVDELAVAFEHQMPDEVIERLYLTLGEPAACPHGFPIPPAGSDDLPAMSRLSTLRVGHTGRAAVSGSTDESVVDFLRSIGLVPGTEVEIVENAPFEGRVVVRIGESRQTISVGVALQVFVGAEMGARAPSEGLTTIEPTS